MTDFEELYERYAKDVYRFVLYLSGSPAEAEDITSETFVRVFTSLDKIRTATVKALRQARSVQSTGNDLQDLASWEQSIREALKTVGPQ